MSNGDKFLPGAKRTENKDEKSPPLTAKDKNRVNIFTLLPIFHGTVLN